MGGGYTLAVAILAIVGVMYIWEEWSEIEKISRDMIRKNSRRRMYIGILIGTVTALVTSSGQVLSAGPSQIKWIVLELVSGPIIGGVLSSFINNLLKEEGIL